MKNWLKKLSRSSSLGQIPDQLKSQLQSENLLLLSEQIRISVIFRNFKAPGKRHGHKRTLGLGSFALTSKRVVGFAGSKPLLDISFQEPSFKLIAFTTGQNKYLSASFDPGVFKPHHSGNTEFRFYLPDVAKAFAYLKSNGAEESVDTALSDAQSAALRKAQDEINEQEWNNANNWHGPDICALYSSKKDNRAWVRKKVPSHGWTINIGIPQGIVWFIVVLIVLLAVGAGTLRLLFSIFYSLG